MNSGWIDAHTHLNDKVFINDFDQLMSRIDEVNIQHINLVGVNLTDTQRALSLVDKYPVF